MKILQCTLIVFLMMANGCSKAKDGAAGAHGAFAVAVVGQKVALAKVEERVPLIGTLAANEWVELKSEVEGRLSEIKFEEGQLVSKGDTLIVIDQEKLRANLAQAKANFSIAKATFDRMSSLVESGAVSRQEFDQASSNLAAQKANVDLIAAQLDEAVIKAPFDGTMGERKVSLGQLVAKSDLMTVIYSQDPMKLEFPVPEKYLSRLAVGQRVELSVAAFPDEKFSGEIFFISPSVDATSRTALVKAKVSNEEAKLRGGMFAKCDLVISQKENALVIPETALISKGDDVFVFTIDKDNKAKMNPVKVGVRMPNKVEILEGLTPDDTVIVEGFQKIGPGSLVSLAVSEGK